jgi:Holliday junction resolvase RusA-like endonuclease
MIHVHHFVIVPGQPVAKGRPRFSIAGHAYTPAKTKQWEDLAALCFRQAIGTPMYDMPLKLEVTAYFQRPKRLCRRKDSPNRVMHTAKPDGDNILKAVSDALQKAGVVLDDSCINRMVITKYYTAKDAPAEVSMMLSSWEDEHEPTDRIRRQGALVKK